MRIFICLLLSMIFISCSKEEDEELCPDITINPTIKVDNCFDNFFFNTGSYWVYQDTVTLQIDSIYVTDWVYQPPTFCEPEQYTINFNSSLTGNFHRKYTTTFMKSNGEFINNEFVWRDDNFCTNSILDSMIINGTTYSNVIKGGFSLGTLYFKENIGAIRRVDMPHLYGDTSVYDLINHQVSLFSRQ